MKENKNGTITLTKAELLEFIQESIKKQTSKQQPLFSQEDIIKNAKKNYIKFLTSQNFQVASYNDLFTLLENKVLNSKKFCGVEKDMLDIVNYALKNDYKALLDGAKKDFVKHCRYQVSFKKLDKEQWLAIDNNNVCYIKQVKDNKVKIIEKSINDFLGA